jgi:hypothetical protein
VKVLISAIWISSVLLAFYVGAYLQSSSTSNANNFQQTKLADELLSAFSQPNMANTENAYDTASTAFETDDVVAQLLEPLEGDYAFSNVVNTWNMMASLDQQQVLQTLNSLTNQLDDKQSERLFQLLFGKYVEQSPLDAMHYAQNSSVSDRLRARLLRRALPAYIKADPEGALMWYKNQDESLGSSYSNMTRLFHELAKQDVDLALEQLFELPEELSARGAVHGVILELSKDHDFIDVVDKFSGQGDDRNVTNLIAKWPNSRLDEVSTWINQVESVDARREYSRNLLYEWLGNDSRAATDWYMNNATEVPEDVRVKRILSAWPRRDLEPALNWLQSQTNVDQAEMTKTLLSRHTSSSPAVVEANLTLLEPYPKQYLSIAKKLYRTYKKMDPAKAEAFVERSPHKQILAPEICKYEQFLADYYQKN